MDKVTLKFDVVEQVLQIGNGPFCYASNTINYIECLFNLHGNWKDLNPVSAIWNTPFATIATVLDENGRCVIPTEVLSRKGKVSVNLVGTRSSDDEITERLTTYPIVAVNVAAAALTSGTETQTITPSQFEQYIQAVEDIVASIPTKLSEFDNDTEFITAASLPTKLSDLTNDEEFITSADIPTNVSDFYNDSGYITLADLPIYDGSVE